MSEFHQPLVTALAAGLLGLVFIALSAQVVLARRAGRVLLGTGDGQDGGRLLIAIRAHGNFAEYVPLCLVLIGLLELQSGPSLLVEGLALALVLVRLAHPVGMAKPGVNAFRAVGFAGTMMVLAITSLALVVRAVS